MDIVVGKVLREKETGKLALFNFASVLELVKLGLRLPHEGEIKQIAEPLREHIESDDSIDEILEIVNLLYWIDINPDEDKYDDAKSDFYPVADLGNRKAQVFYSHQKNVHPVMPIFYSEEQKEEFYNSLKHSKFKNIG